MNTPTTVPLSLHSGDTALWAVSLNLYPANLGWALTYVLNGPQKIPINAVADGAAHKVEVDPATTSGWATGDYSWVARASKDGQTFTVATGLVEILADPTAINITDTRPHCKKVLDYIEALIEGRVQNEEHMVEAKGLKLERLRPDELIRVRREYLAEWQRYKAKSAGRKTQTIKVGFK